MLYSFKKINIEAPFPTTQCGHSSQTYELSTYHDHLYARVFSFKDENNWIIHFSFDLLAFSLEKRNELEKYLRDYYHNSNIHVITSTTHTHYANNIRSDKYVNYLMDLLCKEATKMEYKELDNITSSYQRIHTTAIGKSRISGYETDNENLCLIRFYSNDDNFMTIVYYNCHPTILSSTTQYFSSEYPGYVLERLEDTYPDIDFTFLQGAAGDISSRFTRDGQDYDALEKLGDKLYDEIINLTNKEAKRIPLTLEYKEVPVEYEHEFKPIDLSNIRADLSQREMETIKIGQEMRAQLEKSSNPLFGNLIKNAVIASLNISSVEIVFFPNEIFSYYMNYLDLDLKMLVSYSNGYGPYVLPPDFKFITYEMFTDTLTRETKEKIIEILKTI